MTSGQHEGDKHHNRGRVARCQKPAGPRCTQLGCGGDRLAGGGVGGGEVRRRPCGKRRDLHPAPFSCLEASATPRKPAVLRAQPPPSPRRRPAAPHHRPLRCDPLATTPTVPPTPEAGVGAPARPGEGQPARAPARAQASTALSRGRPGPLPAAPRAWPRPEPRAAAPAAPGPFPGGQLLARRGLQHKGRGVVDGGGGQRRRGCPWRPRRGRDRSGSAAISRGRYRREERRATGDSRPGWEGEGVSGVGVSRGWGAESPYSRSAPAPKQPSARSLARD